MCSMSGAFKCLCSGMCQKPQLVVLVELAHRCGVPKLKRGICLQATHAASRISSIIESQFLIKVTWLCYAFEKKGPAQMPRSSGVSAEKCVLIGPAPCPHTPFSQSSKSSSQAFVNSDKAFLSWQRPNQTEKPRAHSSKPEATSLQDTSAGDAATQ